MVHRGLGRVGLLARRPKSPPDEEAPGWPGGALEQAARELGEADPVLVEGAAQEPGEAGPVREAGGLAGEAGPTWPREAPQEPAKVMEPVAWLGAGGAVPCSETCTAS
ncbi:hypothetical protein E2562_023097 [Oryza meyeriana var. granulata]|uniref:Uncharacterized protein n=1 Tax=Oryza meyeriana var. granulata TaxID=110450 RepID=A0A6G1E035_9ORYZ|nr:hypothetical protein E2562_023097 [Oryza meyeriana var. granulata]